MFAGPFSSNHLWIARVFNTALRVGPWLGFGLVACSSSNSNNNSATTMSASGGSAGSAPVVGGSTSVTPGGTGGSVTAGGSTGIAAGGTGGNAMVGAGGMSGSTGLTAGAGGTSPGGNSGVGGVAAGGGGAQGNAGTGGAGGSASGGAAGADTSMSFFITSTGNATGDLGGLTGADMKCQTLAAAQGQGAKMWHAYLSAEAGPVNAKDRIGSGPWYNSMGVLLAANLTDLHMISGDYTLFLDENGDPVPGQWAGSPAADGVQHDILTGSNIDGTLKAGYTCADWTSADAGSTAWVGHTDGLGPNGSTDPMYHPWNSVHENGGCNDTVPRGGAGRIACFAVGN